MIQIIEVIGMEFLRFWSISICSVIFLSFRRLLCLRSFSTLEFLINHIKKNHGTTHRSFRSWKTFPENSKKHLEGAFHPRILLSDSFPIAASSHRHEEIYLKRHHFRPRRFNRLLLLIDRWKSSFDQAAKKWWIVEKLSWWACYFGRVLLKPFIEALKIS